ncbi:hypothetical protein FACS1894158_18650 [Betaproteobacteria bacterium]|nr:hypothetical protein FACS1894158_18650 [Betaproteobacteria bacterium]GHU20197.1 hypothetical protein FACS189475_08680 [Betaproteobacteria bacterium]
MQLSDPVQILNLNDFLPLDGEDKIEIFTDGGELNLDIFYEVAGVESRTAKLRIHFSYAHYFVKTPFPGYSFIYGPDDSDSSLLYSLVEYQRSDVLDQMCKFSEENGFRHYTGYKHYRLFLHSVGVAIHVIAKSCEISNEELIG